MYLAAFQIYRATTNASILIPQPILISGHYAPITYIYIYLIQNSQAVKKECGPEKAYGEKRCEIQGGGQEMAVMVG